MTTSPHIIKQVAIEQIADLHRAAAPRPEVTAKPRPERRVRRAHKPQRAIPVAPVEDR